MNIKEWESKARATVDEFKKSENGWILTIAEEVKVVHCYEYKGEKRVRLMYLFTNPKVGAYSLATYMKRELTNYNPDDHDLSVLFIDGKEIARLASNSHWEITLK